MGRGWGCFFRPLDYRNGAGVKPVISCWSIVLLAVLCLAGCAGLSNEPLTLRDSAVDLAWPPAPNPPRVRFLREITGPEQIVPNQGKLGHLWQMVTGEERVMVPLITPYGIAADGGSLLCVADSSARVVQCYDLEKREVNYIRQAGDEPFASPVGVAFDSNGNVLVSDSVNARVYVFSPQGEYLRELSKGEVAFQRPAGIAVAVNGDVYVVDVLAHKLNKFDKAGRYLGGFPREESGAPLSLPSNVAVDREGSVYVTDSMNFTVKKYDSEGNYVRSFGEIGDAPGSFARPRGVAVDSDLHVYVVDASFDNFQIFDQEGKLLLFVGKPGKGPGEFYLPSGIFIDKHDRIFVSDTYNKRILIFEYLRQGTP